MSTDTPIENFERRKRDLRDIPVGALDRSKWPSGVRPVAQVELDRLGIDRDGRLHWDGKPVEIIGQRIDLTKTQFALAWVVAIATVITAVATLVLGWTAYHDWACKFGWPTVVTCPQPATSAPGLPRGVVRPAP
jgi:hypothetical protein